jgi:NarL family two-component system sensor histidine kinase LiaS
VKRKRISFTRATSKPGEIPTIWKGLQARMTLSYIWVTLAAAFLLEFIHATPISFLPHLHLTWNRLVRPDIFGLVVVALIGGLFGIISTRGLTRRLLRIAAATTRFATGQYDQRLPVVAEDEIGQLEAHFNQMAEQLAEHLVREKSLIEQNVRLEERARISRDLHDSVKQQAFALAVQVELAHSLLDQDQAAVREHLDFADELSYQIQQELTSLIHALRPASLQTKGLTSALRDYVAAWSRRNRITADIQIPETCALPSEIEEALWWLTQEALSNVARHSQATRICLHLAGTELQVTFSLSDNGQGFDPQVETLEGIGLRSIRERIEQIGGTVLIQSAWGRGTRIIACCPLLPIVDHTSAPAGTA